MLKEDLKYITIEHLLNTNQILVRTANCCHNAEFDSLYDIISYYEQGSSFSTIRNAGKLTCEELKNLCEGYLSNLSVLDFQNVENKNLMIERKTEGELLYESLSTNQSLLIEQKYSELLSQCSVRTCNGLQKFTANEFIESYVFCDSNELIKIKNIGKKSINEINELRSKLKAFIEEIKYIDDSPLECIKLKTGNKYGDFCDNDFITNFYEKHSHLPMFWILEQYIKNDNSTRIEILIDSFHVFQQREMLSLEEMAQKHNLSRERIRQIRNLLFHNTIRVLLALIYNRNEGILQNKDDWAYFLDTVKEIDIICQESYEVLIFLREEHCNFSVEFVLQIVAYIFRDKYSLFGGIDVSNRFRIWDTTFLVKNEYSDIFDFGKMRDEFSNVLMDNEADYL
jgi:hypothetical protein